MKDVPCPHCGHGRPYEITTRNRLKCRRCHKQYSVKSAGLYRSSKIPLKVIEDICQILKDHPRISISSIARMHKLSYRGAYYLVQKIHQIRTAR